MRTKFAFLSALLLFFLGQVVFAQVTGTVQNDFGPVADAEVTVRGSDAQSFTDDNGYFSIDAKIGDVIVVEDLAGVTQDFEVTKRNMGILNMSQAVVDVGEVVITGAYDRTRTKKETMGAETTLDEATFENRATSSFLNSMQGHAPGVVIASASGSPGSAKIDVLIRGRGSINASTDPLIVVDGIVVGAAQFRNLNQEDFEQVSILRDAHATAIYGNRGANGVILITTKKGKAGVPLSVELSMMHGVFTLPQNDYNMANAKESLTLHKMRGLGYAATLSDEEIANWDGPDTNWRDVFFRPGSYRNYNVSFSQGSDTFRSYYSVGYNDTDGLLYTTDFKRFTARANISGNSENKKFTYEGIVNVAYSIRHESDAETNSNISNNVVQNPLFGSLLGLPWRDPYIWDNGRDAWEGMLGPNATHTSQGYWAYSLMDVVREGAMPNRRTENSVLASFAAGYEFFDGLILRNKIGIDYKHNTRTFARAPWSFLAWAVADANDLKYPGFEDHSSVQDATISNVLSLNWNRTFAEKHRIQLGAYLEYIKAHYRASTFRQSGLVEGQWKFGAGSGWAPRDGNLYVPEVFGEMINAGSFSYFGTMDYEFDERYGVGATIRRDAASKFRKDKKWGTFWSTAARWVISEEDFMKNSRSVNLLKLRGSYGVTGNQIIIAPGYGTNPLFMGTSAAWDYYTADDAYQNSVGFYPVVGNAFLGWEETHQANVGFDFVLFSNSLEGNIDVYRKVTKELYTDINLSAFTGAYDVKGNNGELENKGIEVALRYKVFKGQDFNLTLWANTAYNENKILSLPDEDIVIGGASLAEGHPIREYYMIPYAGVDPDNGDYLYYDFEGNIVNFDGIDPERDVRWTGKSLLPKWVGGFGLSADYKGWYTDINFSYQADFYKWDNLFWWLFDLDADMNMTADLLDSWTPENPNASLPAITANNVYDGNSDRLLQDASFLRLRSVTIGYNFPAKALEGTFVKGLNIFAQGENLYLWTKWRGFDPEGQDSNFTLSKYPNPRIISVGVNVKF